MVTRQPAPRFPIVAWLEARTVRQRRIAIALAGLIGLAWLVRAGAGIVLDRWWFASVTDAPVWSAKITAQVLAGLGGAVISAAIVFPVTRQALRVEPAVNPNRLIVRYLDRMGPAHTWVAYAVALAIVGRSAVGGAARWQWWLLFWRGRSTGVTAPEIGFDLGFHLFRLPLLSEIAGWLLALLLGAILLTCVLAVGTGALRLPGTSRPSARPILDLLFLLAGLYALVHAAVYLLVSRPALATNPLGAFDGPGWTEVRVIAPSLIGLALVALAVATISLRSIRRGTWRTVAAAFGVWAGLHVLVLTVLPALVQSLVVKPAEAERQLPYIAHNLDATRLAYQLDSVDQVSVQYTDGIAPGAAQGEAALGTVPLFGEEQLVDALQVLQGTAATRILDVDLDRYVIDGERRPVLVAARGAHLADLPERGWVQEHLVYTHGDGVVAIPADQAGPDGRPDVDALADLVPDRPQLYFGERLAGWYAIVGTDRTEIGGEPFAGNTGIMLDSAADRAVVALALGAIEPLVSSELSSDSQLLFRRDLRERLTALAPFLTFDANAYPVITDDRIVWVTDGYTTSSTYPYAQRAGSTGALGGGGSDLNYVRGSIKATVDAYDGTVHFYQTEVGGAGDPVLEAWKGVFPGLIEPISNMPADIAAHLLYPPDLLTVQTALLGRYHVDDAETLFSGADSWTVSTATGSAVAADASGPTPAVSLFMPGSERLGGHWVSIRPFSPGALGRPSAGRDELVALAIADHDNPEHVLIERIERRPGRQVSSPQVAQSAIDTDRDLAAQFTLLNANGSSVQFGPMTPVPLQGGVVWVRSIIVTGTAGSTTPRLYGVAAVSNGLVGFGGSVAEALAAAAG